MLQKGSRRQENYGSVWTGCGSTGGTCQGLFDPVLSVPLPNMPSKTSIKHLLPISTRISFLTCDAPNHDLPFSFAQGGTHSLNGLSPKAPYPYGIPVHTYVIKFVFFPPINLSYIILIIQPGRTKQGKGKSSPPPYWRLGYAKEKL